MIASIAWRCSRVNSAAATGVASSSIRTTALSQRRGQTSITIKSPISERRQSIVEVLRLAVNILGAGKRRRGAHQQLLGPGGLLHGVFFLAVGKRLLGQ